MRVVAAIGVACLALGTGSHALAAEGPPASSGIEIVGVGEVATPPEVAELDLALRGEGATADKAAADLEAKRAALEEGLASSLPAKVAFSTGRPEINVVRGKDCDEDEAHRLSKGACAVQGYLAEMPVSVRVSPADQAGTALSLAARLGASGSVSAFNLLDMASAQRRATAAAFADARARAEAIASASGVRLGAVVRVRDETSASARADEVVVTARRREPVALAPVVINLKPEPIKTYARLSVTFAIAP